MTRPDKKAKVFRGLTLVRQQNLLSALRVNKSFLIKAIINNYRPRVINIDKSGCNTVVIKVYNKRSFSKIKIRQCKQLNNIVEQDHRFIKWRIQNGLGFKSFESARGTLSGIEVAHMLRKNQMVKPGITMLNHSVNWRAKF